MDVQKIKDLQEKNITLVMGKDSNFYYLYYAGMGSTGFHKLSSQEQISIKRMVIDDVLDVTEERIDVPVHAADLDRMVLAVFYKINVIKGR